MKNNLATLCLATIAIVFTSVAGNASSPPTVVTVGDSTVATYPEEDVKRGWGQVLGDYLAPSVQIINLAECGRSTKTFLDTGRWQKALEAKPDLILIQFGHNDSHAKDKPESTDANTDFQEYLRRYVSEARAAGAKPVLVTPMHRLLFVSGSGEMTQELKPYADAIRHVAEETGTPLIDLYTLSGEVFEPMGDSGVAGLTASNQDRTHFTEKGARLLARLVAEECGKIDSRLKRQGDAIQP